MWEYKIMQADKLANEENLNKLGERGWELVTIMEADWNENGPTFHFYLKRRVQN